MASAHHPLVDTAANARLHDYAARTLARFEVIAARVDALSRGGDLPDGFAGDPDPRRLHAWLVFRAYEETAREWFADDPLAAVGDETVTRLMHAAGLSRIEITPCADGRLAHALSHVLRLPQRALGRHPRAGALCRTDDLACDEGGCLVVTVYHFSSVDPDTQGCAAHGSDTDKAAREGLARLREACAAQGGATPLLLGLDTATDALRVHVPERDGAIDVSRWLESAALFDATAEKTAQEAERHVLARVEEAADVRPEMAALIARLIVNDFAQIALVRAQHGGFHPDIGHAERFICAGDGFAEVQLRNLAYLARVRGVGEAAFDLDVGVKILTGLNVKHGRPIPLVLRHDYEGAADRERAVALCARNAADIRARYADLVKDGMLHILQVVRDIDGGAPEVLADSTRAGAQGA